MRGGPFWRLAVFLVAVFVACFCAGFVLWQLHLPDCWMGC